MFHQRRQQHVSERGRLLRRGQLCQHSMWVVTKELSKILYGALSPSHKLSQSCLSIGQIIRRRSLWRLIEVPSARLTLHSTKLCTNFKIFGKKHIFWYYGYLWGFVKHFPKFEVQTSSGRHTNETFYLLTKLWSFKVIWTFLGAPSWLCCAPADGLTKNVVK